MTSGDDRDWQHRVEELERQVAVLQRMVFGREAIPLKPRNGTDPNKTVVSAQVCTLAAAGNMIGAIKMLGDETGLSLRQAKDVVERL